ncbi:LicD family protein [Paenibacillus cymbidii]|uniref:LicD family protein n=1 Tax=Paenibacillus cymbidii TaxID=1639034 RepID=UPI001436BBFD|nr:LicD family protein [Paenibacillus cymbidii]
MKTQKVSIRDIQLKLLDIIDYIDELCKKNKIQYFLIGGSALGAVRHKGFIPWDDDFDIAMTNENYLKFLKVCEEQLDKDRYFFQREASEKWPLYFTKIRMNGTVFREPDAMCESHMGIFIDVFSLENIADGIVASTWQYICSKIVIARTLAQRGYMTATFGKRVVMSIIKRISNRALEKVLINQVRRYNKEETKRLGILFGNVRFKNAFIPREFFGTPEYIEFEGRFLPVPGMTHEFLRKNFGDYMKLPPKEKQFGHLPEEVIL